MTAKKCTRWLGIALAIMMFVSCFPAQVAAGSDGTYLIKFKNGTAEDGVISTVIYTSEIAYGDPIPAPTGDILNSFDWPADQGIDGWYMEGDSSKTPVDFSTCTCTGDITLLPIYQDLTACYVFFASDGLATAFQTVTRNTTVPTSDIPAPVRAGYTFAYWSADKTTAFSFATTPITEHTTLYAVWTPQTVPFKVRFYMEKVDWDEDATPGDFSEYDYILTTPALSGTAGESTNVTASTLSTYGLDDYFDGTENTDLKYTTFQAADNMEISGDGTTVINAFVTRKTYTISYDLAKSGNSDYGMVIDGTTYTGADPNFYVEVKYGNLLNGPNTDTEFFAPTLSYGVTRWIHDTAMSGYTPGYGAILYPDNRLDENYLSADGQTLSYTFTASWGAYTNAYHMRYWYEPLGGESGYLLDIPDDSATYDSSIAGKCFLYAPADSFTYYYSGYGPFQSTAGDGFSALCLASGSTTKGVGQTFVYQANEGLEFYLYAAPDAYQTVSFFCSRNSYDLVFDVQTTETQTTDYSPISLKYETALASYQPDDPVRSGYEFLGWYENLDFDEPFDFSSAAMPATNFELYAKWREIVPEYTVNFYNYYGGQIIASETVRVGETTPEQDCYIAGSQYELGAFDGWRYHISATVGTSSEFSFNLPIYDNVDVYAAWNPGYYQITYDLAGGTGTTPVDSDYYAPGTTARVASSTGFSRSSYTFTGWVDQNGTAYESADFATIESDLILTAQWKSSGGGGGGSTTYSVTYNANGGTGSYKDSGITSGTSYTILSSTDTGISYSGYTFHGWNTKADGTGTSYSACASITIKSSITLYAQWTEGEGNGYLHVTYYPNGATSGAVPVDSTDYSSGDTVTLLYNTGLLRKSGSYFTGWSFSTSGGTVLRPGTQFMIGNSDVQLYACWSPLSSGSGSNLETLYDTEVPLASLTTDHIWYIQGYPDNSVRPDGNLTRAEAAAIFYRLIDDSGKAQADNTVGFSDVQQTDWYYHEVAYLTNHGILFGYADGTFRGNAAITRAEFAAIASRFDALLLDQSNAFSDVSDSHWAVLYINSAASKGWITGYADGTFRPDTNITRAETATLINRVLDRALVEANEPNDLHVYTDLDKTHWAYYEIMEASHTHDYTRNAAQEELWTNYTYAPK
ncbi:MAG: InlB B-repeat-containing protein [Oscillospiraceae bacterium]|nr:InlB B-repeat-containing protein [Oscillospiraceae bacterium]